MTAGLPLLFVGLACLEISLFTDTEWPFYAATVASGIAVGLIVRGGLSEIKRQFDPAHRAEVVSTFFAIAYVGLGLPVVLIGAIAQAVGSVDASTWVAGLNAAAILIAAVVVFRAFGKTVEPAPSTVCPDSWCNSQQVGAPGRL